MTSADKREFLLWVKESSQIAWNCIEILLLKVKQDNALLGLLFEQINNINIENLEKLLLEIETFILDDKSKLQLLYDQVSRNDGIDYNRRYGLAMWYLDLLHKIKNTTQIKARL